MLPFVGGTRLAVERGMTGATGNWYCGLWEADEMGFLLHFLRPGDLFLDVGANVGSHTVLASGAVGAQTIAVEPVPTTFAKLQLNIRTNDLGGLVEAHCCGLSDRRAEIEFTSGMDTLNRVALAGDDVETIRVPVCSLDELCAGRVPKAIKIDVEGHEAAVLGGAAQTLSRPELAAALLETRDLGNKYGSSDQQLIETMKQNGFVPCVYDARSRTLKQQDRGGFNTIFVRDLESVQAACREAPQFVLVNGRI
jgi:FkbM family methyltransferase